ncbi:hypothetical protein [Fluviicola sp.]|uniref:hypothetical protein n=1 Tax=Fluviicola sp. TaxID=1917219 RepID=UPI002607F519|nr:hypothetical protein [Fluviicola sp.]
MNQNQELNDIFEIIKDQLEPGVTYHSYSIKGNGLSTSGSGVYKITGGKRDFEIPDVLSDDRENRMNPINRRIRKAEFDITVQCEPERFVYFTLSQEGGFSYRIADTELLVEVIKLELMDNVDAGCRKEIFSEITPDKETGLPEPYSRQIITYDNGDVKEYSGAPVTDFAKALFHAQGGKMEQIHVFASKTEVIIETKPQIPGLTELYVFEEDLTLDSSNLEAIYAFMESFSDAKMAKAIEALQENPDFKAQAEKRYLSFIQARVGEEAGLESFAKASLKRKEEKLFDDWHFVEEVISLSRLDEKECQTIVNFVGSLVLSHLDLDAFETEMKAAEDETDLRNGYAAAAEKVKDGIITEANNYPDGWFGKLSLMLANQEVEKILFEKTHFKLENNKLLKAFVFYWGLNNSQEIYLDIYQSYVNDLTEFFWFLPTVPKSSWGDTELVLPEYTLKFRRRAVYRLGDDEKWIRNSPTPASIT